MNSVDTMMLAAEFPIEDQPDIAFLLDYWQARCVDGTPPLRRAMDPIDFPQLLPRIGVVEALWDNGARRFRYRLLGGDIVARIGRDPTGQFFEDVYNDEGLASTLALYNQLLDTGNYYSSHAEYDVGQSEQNLLYYDRLILPMRSRPDQSQADQLMLLFVVTGQTGEFQPTGSFWRSKR